MQQTIRGAHLSLARIRIGFAEMLLLGLAVILLAAVDFFDGYGNL